MHNPHLSHEKNLTEIFGIPIEGLSADVLMEHMRERRKPFWVVTVNPEILLSCRSRSAYAHAVRQANTRTVDGFGVWLLLRMFGKKTHRVTGADFAERVVAWAAEQRWKVGFFGGGRWHSTQAAADSMKKKYPAVQIVCEEGGIITRDGDEDAEAEEARYRLMMSELDVLLVALDHVKQEQWILKHLQDFPKLRLVMGVGGTFDFWSGTIRRAPTLFRAMGLEWVWRFMKEPERYKRIFRAVIIFPLLFLIDQCSKKY